MCNSKIKRLLEPIGLALLLIAFGWQCWEEHASQMEYEGYIYELDKKLTNIWDAVYDEALHSDRYKGQSSVWVNYDSHNQSMKDWNQIQEGFAHLQKQTSFFFWARVVLYILGSILVICAKVPAKQSDYGNRQ